MILAHSEHLLFVKEFKIFLLLGYYVTLSQTFCLHFSNGNCPCLCFSVIFCNSLVILV